MEHLDEYTGATSSAALAALAASPGYPTALHDALEAEGGVDGHGGGAYSSGRRIGDRTLSRIILAPSYLALCMDGGLTALESVTSCHGAVAAADYARLCRRLGADSTGGSSHRPETTLAVHVVAAQEPGTLVPWASTTQPVEEAPVVLPPVPTTTAAPEDDDDLAFLGQVHDGVAEDDMGDAAFLANGGNAALPRLQVPPPGGAVPNAVAPRQVEKLRRRTAQLLNELTHPAVHQGRNGCAEPETLWWLLDESDLQQKRVGVLASLHTRPSAPTTADDGLRLQHDSSSDPLLDRAAAHQYWTLLPGPTCGEDPVEMFPSVPLRSLAAVRGAWDQRLGRSAVPSRHVANDGSDDDANRTPGTSNHHWAPAAVAPTKWDDEKDDDDPAAVLQRLRAHRAAQLPDDQASTVHLEPAAPARPGGLRWGKDGRVVKVEPRATRATKPTIAAATAEDPAMHQPKPAQPLPASEPILHLPAPTGNAAANHSTEELAVGDALELLSERVRKAALVGLLAAKTVGQRNGGAERPQSTSR